MILLLIDYNIECNYNTLNYIREDNSIRIIIIKIYTFIFLKNDEIVNNLTHKSILFVLTYVIKEL